MSIWDVVAKSVDTILLSLVAILLAILGRTAKLFHEDARGIQDLTWSVFFANLPNAIVCGIIALGVTFTAQEYFRVPLYAGVALGGALGHLGIETVGKMLGDAINRFIKKKTSDDTKDS